MFSYIIVGANDIERSKQFYDAVLGVLGANPGVYVSNPTGERRYFYRLDGQSFGITEPINGEPATGANGGTIGFKVVDPDQGDLWHQTGLAWGGVAIEDPPGIRTMAGRNVYLAYLRDPAGNKLCAYKYMG